MKATSAKEAQEIFAKGYFVTVGGVTFHYKMAKDEDYLRFLNKFTGGKRTISGKMIMDRLDEIVTFLLPKYVLEPKIAATKEGSEDALTLDDPEFPTNAKFVLAQLIIGGPEGEQQIAAEWENLS